ncbi:type I polyketide synthase [Streptomyces sp. NRRL F-5650]|jgi:phthiocerol/phenolphthiocerol synthesis type-I polyketide synthase E|uniref:type I polyketide synthase n=1 Tax=Streptomyces sp. NRRL F-5650 TaxID=1463868 RepID=UPI0004CAC3EC|nr:beta-ketoacyl synthase N-terminal-like domain-containing protein [Streptomyces sp. NRRL F-5650]
MTHPDRAADVRDTDIAVIGMACRFPGAPDVDTFWSNLTEGRESVTFFSDEQLLAAGVQPGELADPGYVRAGQLLEDVELFDAGHFGVPDDEAEILDPQHRHFLECSLLALEHAGYEPSGYDGEIGVFAGAGMNTYLLHHLAERYRTASSVGHYRLMLANDKDFLATRVSYRLDLRGPSVSVNTACSTSLVAVHTAGTSLLAGECSIALAGAVHLRLPQTSGYVHQEGMIFSPDGHCRAFDADARGTVIGSGVGVVVLKRLAEALEDGDTVHAVIKGSAVNNDGAAKTGYTAPSVEGQAAVVVEAQEIAGCAPQTVGYVEAHGTATPLGDPIEVAALTEAFGDAPAPGSVALGSVKTNIGHLDTAAGMAGLIKTVLMLRERTLVPSLHFRTPNPEIDFGTSPFRVNTELRPWHADGGPLRAGVSSFGIGGTNAHVVLEEPPAAPAPEVRPRPAELLVLSARTPEALDRLTGTLARYLRGHRELDPMAVAHTLAVGRQHHAHRRWLVARSTRDAARSLAILDPARVRTEHADLRRGGVALVVGAPGDQTGAFGADLYRDVPAFRAAVDDCARVLDVPAAAGPEYLLDPAEPLAGFVAQLALARTLQEWGVRPEALVGWGAGQAVAGCLAGVFALGDALALARAYAGDEPGPGSERLPAPGELPLCLGPRARWLDGDTLGDPAFWAKPAPHGPDAEALTTLLAESGLTAVDITLDADGTEHASATERLLDIIGTAWAGGADVDFTACFPAGRERRVPLPQYPLERTRHWVEPVHRSAPAAPAAVAGEHHDPARVTTPAGAPGGTPGADGGSLGRRLAAAGPAEQSRVIQDYLVTEVAGVLGVATDAIDKDRSLFDMHVDSLILIDLTARLGTALGRQVPSSAFVEYPTVRAFADHLVGTWHQDGNGDGGPAPVSTPAVRTSRRASGAARRR